MIISQISTATDKLTLAISAAPMIWKALGARWPSATPTTMQSPQRVKKRSKIDITRLLRSMPLRRPSCRLAEPVLQRHLVEAFQRQGDKGRNPVAHEAEGVVESAFLVYVAALDCRRVFDAPMRGHGMAGPYGARFAGRAVTNREDEIHSLSVGVRNSTQLFERYPSAG